MKFLPDCESPFKMMMCADCVSQVIEERDRFKEALEEVVSWNVQDMHITAGEIQEYAEKALEGEEKLTE